MAAYEQFKSMSMEGHTEQGAPAMKSGCESCKWHSYAERKSNSLISKLWRWHTKWCPGWTAYQKELAKCGEESRDF